MRAILRDAKGGVVATTTVDLGPKGEIPTSHETDGCCYYYVGVQDGVAVYVANR